MIPISLSFLKGEPLRKSSKRYERDESVKILEEMSNSLRPRLTFSPSQRTFNPKIIDVVVSQIK